MIQTTKPTQKETILGHLQQSGSITPLQAFGMYGVYRLAAVIHRLRGDGYPVKTVDKRDPTGDPYAEYHLAKDAQPA